MDRGVVTVSRDGNPMQDPVLVFGRCRTVLVKECAHLACRWQARFAEQHHSMQRWYSVL